jgi:hypothetical protein
MFGKNLRRNQIKNPFREIIVFLNYFSYGIRYRKFLLTAAIILQRFGVFLCFVFRENVVHPNSKNGLIAFSPGQAYLVVFCEKHSGKKFMF